jgi:hypothetical protein
MDPRDVFLVIEFYQFGPGNISERIVFLTRKEEFVSPFLGVAFLYLKTVEALAKIVLTDPISDPVNPLLGLLQKILVTNLHSTVAQTG